MIRIWLVVYFLLVVGAVVALSVDGVLTQLPVGWVILGLLAAVSLGVLLAAVSRQRLIG